MDAAVVVVLGAAVVGGVVVEVVSGVSLGADSSVSSPPQLVASSPKASNKIDARNTCVPLRFVMKNRTPPTLDARAVETEREGP